MKILIIIILILNIDIIGKIINIVLPFILSFLLAYLIYPFYKLINNKIPKIVSVLIIILVLILLLLLVLSIIPFISSDVIILIQDIINYISYLSIKYDIDLSIIISNLSRILDYKYIISGINIITNFILFIFSFIYIMLDMDKIVDIIRKLKIYNLLVKIDINIKKYLYSLVRISIISLFEYSIGFYIIGHSNYLLIGIIASITNLIPYIGSLIVLISSIILDTSKIVEISILYLILGLIDSYIINPYIYGKYNSINPLISLISISILGYLFGGLGVILSIPICIIIKTIIDNKNML